MKVAPLAGYSDRLSARAGDTIEFKVSSQTGQSVRAWLTRSISADPNPAGLGIVEEPMDEYFPGLEFASRDQPFYPGSLATTKKEVAFDLHRGFSIGAVIFPTLALKTPQTILSVGELRLCILDERLEIHVGDSVVKSEYLLQLRKWQKVSAEYRPDIDHPETGQIILSQSEVGTGNSAQLVSTDSLADVPAPSKSSVTIAASMDKGKASAHFNGKIEAPFIDGSIEGAAMRLQWNFSTAITSLEVHESSELGCHATLINFPMRAATGSSWDAAEMCWRHAPEQYGAIHFHETDIYDFRWETDFTYTIPSDLPSGIYVMHLQSGEQQDAMPFFVCPAPTARKAKLCLLVSTFTYIVYGNHARPDYHPDWQQRMGEWNAFPHNPAEYTQYGLSTYNYHSDKSGICHASHLRPLFNLRPGYLTFCTGEDSGLRHFQADSHLVSWLHHNNLEYDIITDHELHREGVSCLQDYSCVMTGSHPEYHTPETLDALQHYRDNGGHFIYLGGNGFYWRVAIHQEHTGLIEIRRAEDGIRAWAAEPGEYYNAFDGAYGGLWRRSGRPPQQLAGVGFSAQGQFNGSFYRRKSHDPEHQWVFDGVTDELIGDFGFSGGGAAGFELDRADTRLGTPTNAVVLASSEGHGEDFVLVPEEQLTHITNLPGVPEKELLRADMIYFDVPGGGKVFSTGSITFCGSLPWNKFENNVSQILHNVVRRFIA